MKAFPFEMWVPFIFQTFFLESLYFPNSLLVTHCSYGDFGVIRHSKWNSGGELGSLNFRNWPEGDPSESGRGMCCSLAAIYLFIYGYVGSSFLCEGFL